MNDTFKEYVESFYSYYRFQNIVIKQTEYQFSNFGKGERSIVLFSGGLSLKEIWIPYFKTLVENYQILIFEYPTNLDTVDKLINGVHNLVSFLGLVKPIIMGGFEGAFEAASYVASYKEEVGGLIMLNPMMINKVNKSDLEGLIEEVSLEEVDFLKSVDKMKYLLSKLDNEKITYLNQLLPSLTKLDLTSFTNVDYLILKSSYVKKTSNDNHVKYIVGSKISPVINPSPYLNYIEEFIGGLKDEV